MPTESGLLTALEGLTVSESGLEGTLPSQIGLLEQLLFFSTGHESDLTGTLPTEIGQLISVASLGIKETVSSGHYHMNITTDLIGFSASHKSATGRAVHFWANPF